MSNSKLLKQRQVYIGYFSYSEDLNWATQNLRRGLDIDGLSCRICIRRAEVIKFKILLDFEKVI